MLTTVAHGINSGRIASVAYSKEEIFPIWEHLTPLLQRSVDVSKGMISMKLLLEMLGNGDATAFVTYKNDVVESVLVCSAINYSHYRAARILACAGKNLDHAMKNFDMLQSWALVNDCQEIEGWVEPHMARYVRRFGFKPKKQIVSYDLRRKLQ